MGELSDETLLKRANHASRNLTVLAVLGTLVGLVVVALSFSIKGAALPTFVLGATLLVISGGYWVLAVAARRGNPNSVGIVLVLVGVQIALSLIISGIASSRTGGSFQPNTGGLVMPALVFIALHSSRKILLELEDRGLSERAFGPAKPSGNLCMIGGILLVAGFVGLDTGVFYVNHKAGQEKAEEFRRAQAFGKVIRVDELEFMKAMDGVWRNANKAQLEEAVAQLNILEEKLKSVNQTGTDGGQLSRIINNYENALREWKKALLMMQEATPDSERANAMLKLGDRFRSEACEEFNRRYTARGKQI